MVVLFYLPVALGSLLYLLWSGGEYAVATRTLGEQPLVGVALGLAAAVPLVVVPRLLVPRSEPLQRLARALASVTGPLSWASITLMAASAAIGEELLFRAVLQEQLGVVVAVLLFAAVHVPYERDLCLWPVTAIAAGLILALLYELTGAALAPAVAHFVVDLVNLRWLGRADFSAPAPTGSAT